MGSIIKKDPTGTAQTTRPFRFDLEHKVSTGTRIDNSRNNWSDTL